ncbi:MAG: hypothetical protein JXB06_12985, partial [Spirochaetales bacterium]|nr:hypothetical protein [Spirochaetales bacterium]
AVLALSLLLAGCGEISLNQLLESEEPGELRLNPASANVPVETVMTVQGKGGFIPYTYAIVDGGTLDPDILDPETGVFTAPGEPATVTIEVTDYWGRKAQGTLNVFEQLKLIYSGETASRLTVALADLPLDFDASGGVPDPGYVFSVEGESGTTSIDSNGIFSSTDAGQYMVEVSDSIGNSAIATVRVLDINGPLTIDPEVAYVVIGLGNNLQFTAYNYDPDTFEFSVKDPGDGSSTGWFIDPHTNPATYVEPFSRTVDTIVLSDALDTVAATVHVLWSEPSDLEISPASFNEDLEYGDEVIFTVSGGLPPYEYWLEYDGEHGTLEQFNDTQARYTAPNTNTVDWVYVMDALENKLRVKTKVSG